MSHWLTISKWGEKKKSFPTEEKNMSKIRAIASFLGETGFASFLSPTWHFPMGNFFPTHLANKGQSLLVELWYSLISVGFSSGSADKESTCNEGDLGSIPGLGKSSG